MVFAIGDVVQLKSGGLNMTVSFVGEKSFPNDQVVPVIQCTWFEGKKLQKETFKPELLTLTKMRS